METVSDFTFGGSKITADGDCSHEIERRLLLGRKVISNLDSILKSRYITLSTQVHLVKTMVFPVVMYGCESWTVKKAERWRIDAFAASSSVWREVSSSVVPFSRLQSFPASGSFPVSQLFAWGGQSIGVSASPSVLPVSTRIDFLQNGLVGPPCSPRDSEESLPTPQFKSINSSALSFLHSPALTSIHDH